MTISKSYYDFQMEKYGNVLPQYDNPYLQLDEEDENGNHDAEEDQRKFEQEEELWHNENEF